MGRSLSTSWEKVPPCACGGEGKRALYADLRKWGELPSIMRPKHAEVQKASYCVLHHQMAGRGARVLPSQAQTGSVILPHRDHLTPMTCRTKIFNNLGEGMGPIRGQAA
eukprot:89616-Pelagomonas_calceolata.AAC.1